MPVEDDVMAARVEAEIFAHHAQGEGGILASMGDCSRGAVVKIPLATFSHEDADAHLASFAGGF